ncbi:ABC transporter substrate-binding protein [Clavibacter sp. VKM Ac-2542]|nr:ABC transporter substrate-binding protein [Clavibacter sp. VKM Ac-2542]
MLLTYDADRTSASAAPSDWPDLWNDPAYKGRYESAKSMGSTTGQVLVASILSRYADPNGELGVSAEGWDQIPIANDRTRPAPCR